MLTLTKFQTISSRPWNQIGKKLGLSRTNSICLNWIVLYRWMFFCGEFWAHVLYSAKLFWAVWLRSLGGRRLQCVDFRGKNFSSLPTSFYKVFPKYFPPIQTMGKLQRRFAVWDFPVVMQKKVVLTWGKDYLLNPYDNRAWHIESSMRRNNFVNTKQIQSNSGKACIKPTITIILI